MAKRNGGIIGPSNVPTGQYGGTASGVWRLRDAFNYIKAGLWPVAGTYPVGNSLRFNSSSSDTLSRTPASSGNRKTWTWSGWVKRSTLGTQQALFYNSNGATSNGHGGIYIESDNTLWFAGTNDGASYTNAINTNAVLRDVSAWYHIVVVCDTTNATQANRQLIYINSVLQTVTVTQAITLNADLQINRNTKTDIGVLGYTGPAGYLNGYLAEINFVDGQALTPSSFGQTDSATGIWTPLPYTGSFGTNGFYLKFANSAALGTDSSGNGNTFTVNNLTSIDQTTDTPTNNFATLNPLFAGTSSATFAEGNLKYTATGTTQKNTVSTIAVSSGKWFCESKFSVISSGYPGVGIMDSQSSLQTTISYLGSSADSYCIFASGDIYNNGSLTAIGTTFANTDIVGLGLDLDSGTKTLKIYKNGSLVYTQTVSTPANAYVFATSNNLNTSETQFNFGNPIYSANSYTDGAGYGNFSYAVPSGYYSLNTKNLANFG
jgi:hypothetical protein